MDVPPSLDWISMRKRCEVKVTYETIYSIERCVVVIDRYLLEEGWKKGQTILSSPPPPPYRSEELLLGKINSQCSQTIMYERVKLVLGHIQTTLHLARLKRANELSHPCHLIILMSF